MAELQGDPGAAMTPFNGRRALVVGGSGGIGAALAFELGKRGAALIVHGGSSRERLDRVLGGLRSGGVDATGFLMKLEASPASIDGLVAALPSLGPIDILAVAFGPFVRKSLAETGAADWESLALLDLALPGALASALLPDMARRGWGRMLFIGGSRTDGIRSYSTNAAYAAAKTGLGVLVKSLAVEGAGNGVGSVLVCPGLVETEYLGEEAKAALREKAPGKRLFQAGEAAKAAVDLIAAQPCIASGSIVSLDGGLSF
jgi:NAD(P)-dependent dehydrogenase (short-subunit alcohol dehydrogenase family)